MRKLKMWAYSFLSVVLKESLLRDLQAERKKTASLQKEVERLNCYIDGLEYGMRSLRKIQIRVGEVEK